MEALVRCGDGTILHGSYMPSVGLLDTRLRRDRDEAAPGRTCRDGGEPVEICVPDERLHWEGRACREHLTLSEGFDPRGDDDWDGPRGLPDWAR